MRCVAEKPTNRRADESNASVDVQNGDDVVGVFDEREIVSVRSLKFVFNSDRLGDIEQGSDDCRPSLPFGADTEGFQMDQPPVLPYPPETMMRLLAVPAESRYDRFFDAFPVFLVDQVEWREAAYDLFGLISEDFRAAVADIQDRVVVERIKTHKGL